MSYDYHDYVEQMQARARRERAEAVHRLIVAPIVAFFRSEVAPGTTRHAPRSHLARQG